MSLINSVLRDLDKRRAGDGERGALPNEVRSLPASSSAPSLKAIGIALVVIAAAAGAALLMLKEPPPPAVAAVPVPSPPPAVAQALVPPSVASPVVVASAPTQAEDLPPADQGASPAVVSLRLDESLSRLPSAPLRESAGDAKRASTEPARAASQPLTREPKVAAVSAAVRPPPTAPAPPEKPARPLVEDDWSRAEQLLRENRKADAEPLLQQILRKNPAQTRARHALLDILLPLRRHAEAAEVLAAGLVHSPEQTNWAMNLARLQADRNDYSAAWETLSRSLPHARQQADFVAFCGTVLQRLGRNSEALGYYQEALRLKPQEARWWVGLGIVLEAERNPTDAREAYRRARAVGNLPPELSVFVDQKLR